MKLAVLTDLHANREALEAVLEHARAQEVQRYALLGDFVGYGAEPGWVLDTARELVAQGAIALLGNHDEAALKGAPQNMRADAREAIAWTQRQLSPAQLDFLRSLPLTQREGAILFVHANAVAPGEWGYVRSRSDAVASLQAGGCQYLFCGHMHDPRLYYLSGTAKCGDFVPSDGVPIPVPAHRQWLAVPGSVGQPRDGNPAAAYAILDLAAQELVFHRVPYDHERAADKIREAGLPAWFADRLSDGR